MKIFAQIRKVDEQKRLVYGRAAQEVPDRTDEIFDYATSKPHFEAWSKSFSDATDGKSQGNIRAMHGKVSAGIVKEISFEDTEKAIDIAAHINDDQEWKKVLDGNYTGFSIGGSYIGDRVTEKIGGKEIKRYTASPTEISIVDSPCIPTARFFEVVKADGSLSKVAFADKPMEIRGTPEQLAEFEKTITKADGYGMRELLEFLGVERMLDTVESIEKREFSAEERKQSAKEGHALPDGSFPIENKSDLSNAIHAYGRAKDKSKAKAHIIARAKALGASDMIPEDWGKADAPEIVKSDDPLDEAIAEAVRVGALAKEMGDPETSLERIIAIAKQYEEPVTTTVLGDMLGLTKRVLEKAKMSAANMDRLQAAHDHLTAMGAKCADGDEKSVATGALAKVIEAAVAPLKEDLSKAQAEITALKAQPIPHPATVVFKSAPVKKEETTGAPPKADDPLMSKAYDWLVKMGDGIRVDWDASRLKLEQETRAAA